MYSIVKRKYNSIFSGSVGRDVVWHAVGVCRSFNIIISCFCARKVLQSRTDFILCSFLTANLYLWNILTWAFYDSSFLSVRAQPSLLINLWPSICSTHPYCTFWEREFIGNISDKRICRSFLAKHWGERETRDSTCFSSSVSCPTAEGTQ